MIDPKNIRNIAIIAHVDHGKTTLVDELLKAAGTFRDNQVVEERVMDSMDLEREKGITIKAKNTSILWDDKVINIVDTPGHADFGAEVERVMKMVDGVLLVVDAYEGPQAQTRFVLRKALQQGLNPLVVINKIDRENADVAACHDKVLELFMELEATDEQFNAPFLYASARDGYAMRELDDARDSLVPLIETVLDKVPSPEVQLEGEFQMLVSNIGWDDYVGRIAIGRIQQGQVETGDQVYVVGKDGKRTRAKITKVFEYSGLGVSQSATGIAGNIVGIAGFEEVDIGVTICGGLETPGLPFVEIDPATIQMEFAINDGPYAGKEGKYVTSRQIRDRLDRETRTNISIQVEDAEKGGTFRVSARGSMQIAVLVEQMRREGFEVLVSRPTVITKRDADGKLLEPYETIYLEVPEECVGGVMSALNNRRGRMDDMKPTGFGTMIEATISTRGLIGFEFELVNLTSGRGIMSHLFKEYAPFAGEITTRITGTLVSMETGVTTAYSLAAIEERGKLFVGPSEKVYLGQIVGENPRGDDLPVNPIKEKHLTNHRSSGDGKGIQLSPPTRFSLERAIEYLADDEFLDATPETLRLRKRVLCPHERRRIARGKKTA
ncbi:MAG: translational GTPase TypA [Verrucomicrobiales bacterium]|jgi:GTP-binding protein|nr:translational GTPase TypA [Verrucomicrobiales bacterium]MDF1785624.1 translational GTPase TypA [Verrucomicrobiales bacterium]